MEQIYKKEETLYKNKKKLLFADKLLSVFSLPLTIGLMSISVISCQELLNPSLTFDINDDVLSNDLRQYESPSAHPTTSGAVIDYFRNLSAYSPINSKNSCGYVSLIQYLSFYDTFYDDSIIPEFYEQNDGNKETMLEALKVSPGVLRQSYPIASSYLYNFVLKNKSTDYQMYLMYLFNQAMGNGSSNYDSSIGMWDYQTIFDKINAFNGAEYSYLKLENFGTNAKINNSSVVSGFDSYVKQHLDNDEPVILHIAKYNSFFNTYSAYHSVVAYYYDSLGIHTNFGWNEDYTDVIPTDAGYYIKEAGVMDVSAIKNSHSSNYLIDGEHYCGCGKLTTHNYKHHYETYSKTNHKAYCECGAYQSQNHNMKTGSMATSGGKKMSVCENCGYKIELGSSFVELTSEINID